MATATRPDQQRVDDFGIERVHADDPSFIDKLRDKWGWFDHIMRMQERFSREGGNQYSAGITYFSVLSMFPLLMLGFAVTATVLINRPDVLQEIKDHIVASVDGSLGETLNEILDTAIQQRAAMFGIGGLTALWSGLNWMNHLRYGVSKMWQYPVVGNNFVLMKLRDLIGLIGLLLALTLAFAATAIGSSGVMQRLIELLNLDEVPGIFILTFALTLAVALLANFAVSLWFMKYLPRGEVPWKPALQAAVICAIGFEVVKQVGTVFFANALSNPAGAAFGPIIGLMVVLYLIWRIVMYSSAWAATTEEALAIARQDAPAPAIIRVRDIRDDAPNRRAGLGVGLALGAAVGALLRK